MGVTFGLFSVFLLKSKFSFFLSKQIEVSLSDSVVFFLFLFFGVGEGGGGVSILGASQRRS